MTPVDHVCGPSAQCNSVGSYVALPKPRIAAKIHFRAASHSDGRQMKNGRERSLTSRPRCAECRRSGFNSLDYLAATSSKFTCLATELSARSITNAASARLARPLRLEAP